MSSAYIPSALRTETETYFQGRCAYCQSPQALMNVTFEVDHILPEKAGGKTVIDNLAFACPLCNAFKGARTHGWRDRPSLPPMRTLLPATRCEALGSKGGRPRRLE